MKRSSTRFMLANFASRTVNMAMNVVVTGITGAVGSYAQGRLEPPPQCYNDTNPSQEIPCTSSSPNALGIICGAALSIFGIALARGIYKQYCRAAPAVAGAAPAAPAAAPPAAPPSPPGRDEFGEGQGDRGERTPTATYHGLPSP